MTLTGLLMLYLLLCALALIISIVKHLVKGILVVSILLALGWAGAMGLMGLFAAL